MIVLKKPFFLIFIADFLITIAYLFNDRIGMIMMLLVICILIFRKKQSFLENILMILIISVPTSYIGFAGKNQHQTFSWFTLTTFILLVYLLRNYLSGKCKISRSILLTLTFVLSAIFINCFFEINILNAIFEWFQICLMLIPLCIVFDQKDYLKTQLFEKNVETMISVINAVILASAFGVFSQYCFHYYLHITVGNWTFYPNRVVIDVLIKGYSVLSVILSCGIAINLRRFCDNYKIKYVFFAMICLIGIVLNSSRAGIVVALIISPLIVLPSIIKSRRNFVVGMFLFPVLLFIASVMISIQLQARDTRYLFDDNGRFETYIYAKNLLLAGIKPFLFGSGLSLENYSMIIPHNFILELAVDTGILVTSVVVVMVYKLLKYVKQYKYRHIVYCIFLGSMMITNFQANYYAVIFIIIAVLYANITESSTTNKLRKRCLNPNICEAHHSLR